MAKVFELKYGSLGERTRPHSYLPDIGYRFKKFIYDIFGWEYEIPDPYPLEVRDEEGTKPLTELMEQTGFTKKELRYWYTGFMKDCPDGQLTEKDFIEVYTWGSGNFERDIG